MTTLTPGEIVPELCDLAHRYLADCEAAEWKAAADGDLDRASTAGAEGARLAVALKRQEAAR